MSDKFYPYGKQSIDDEDIQAIIDVLKSDWLTQGPKINEFESALCEKFGANYSSVVSSGTASLHLIALSLKWKPGDIVITSPITFAACANCILYAGATPDFIDIDSKYYTIDPNKLENRIKKYQKMGKKIKAVIGVDYAGNPCDWEALRYLADKYKFQLVNDFCHALGAEYNGDYQYAIKYADVVNMSFHPVKHITSGEGGAALTNNEEIKENINLLRTHGITKNPKNLSKNDGPWYYEMHELGFNYRITDFQCALGINQLKKLDGFITRRREIAKFYDHEFSNDDRFIIPNVIPSNKHAYHLYPLQAKFDKLNIFKKDYFVNLRKYNIGLQVHYIPVHLQPYYEKNFGFKKGDFPFAEEFYRREISIPMYPILTDEDLEIISTKLKKHAI